MLRLSCLMVVMSLVGKAPANNSGRDGFMLLHPHQEVAIKYRRENNLIVVSAIINDSIPVNLILDSGCRNVVLFGRKFESGFTQFMKSPVIFSGLGEGKPLQGRVSIGNRLTMHQVIGRNISVVVVPKRIPFSGLVAVDGVIGYDIFSRFEVEIHPAKALLTFRNTQRKATRDTESTPLLLSEVIPLTNAEIELNAQMKIQVPLLIDTGSQLGLLIKQPNQGSKGLEVLGRGLNGLLFGWHQDCARLRIDGKEIAVNIPASITHSQWETYSSIGMNFLKDYIITIDYINESFSLRRL